MASEPRGQCGRGLSPALSTTLEFCVTGIPCDTMVLDAGRMR